MKKVLIAVVAAVCLTALVPPSLSAGVGLKFGYTSSTLALASTEPIPFSFGALDYFAGGLFFEGGLGFISIQPEILYVRTGGQYEVDEANSLEFRHQYIQVPVLLKLNIIPAGPIRPFLCGGGYGAYLIKSEGVLEIDGVSETEVLTSDYERFDYGLVGGAGIAFKLLGLSLSVEGRYNYGMANLLKDPMAGDSMKNESWMALVGFSF
jgi:hypothetical protein